MTLNQFCHLDGTKIPCFKEQYNEYKYLYSLKKDPNSQYLAKFTVVNCKGKFVGIQFLVSKNIEIL